MSEQKHRKKLNAEQLEVLELLYKFRFGSNDLIAQYFGKKDRSFVFKRLSILLEQELIGKRFDSSYRIQGKPAAISSSSSLAPISTMSSLIIFLNRYQMLTYACVQIKKRGSTS